MNKLSIIVPVYNEKNTILKLLNKLESVTLPFNFQKEIILVDDGSTDGSTDILQGLGNNYIKILKQKNEGKGAAIRSGLEKVSGEYVVVQDADLEYDPVDIGKMLHFIVENNLEVLYGSRTRNLLNEKSGLIFYLGGVLLSLITDVLYNQRLTDEPTCYKMFKSELIKSFPLKCIKFEFCPEVTALTSKKGIKIKEISISYSPRSIKDGKKIKLKDWFDAVWTLLKLRFFK